MSDVTRILSKIEAGDRHASAELLPLVYEELRTLAARRMSAERRDHPIQATALVHEAYIRLVDVKQVQRWDSRGHFFSAAAEAMRRILIESARVRQRRQRQAPEVHLSSIDPVDGSVIGSPLRILELDDTLQKLEQEDPAVAELVRLRLYAGLSVADAAQVLGIGRSTAFEWWNYALAWFRVEMAGHEATD